MPQGVSNALAVAVAEMPLLIGPRSPEGPPLLRPRAIPIRPHIDVDNSVGVWLPHRQTWRCLEVLHKRGAKSPCNQLIPSSRPRPTLVKVYGSLETLTRRVGKKSMSVKDSGVGR